MKTVAELKNRKPVKTTIQSSVPADERKLYQKPDHRGQLKSVKQHQREQVEKKRPVTHSVEIKADEFTYSKDKPLTVENWLLWKNAAGNLVVLPADRRQGEEFKVYRLEDGVVHMVETPEGRRFSYFHQIDIANYLKRYNITRILRKDPNGEYWGRNKIRSGIVSEYSFGTDGTWVESDTTALSETDKPKVAMKYHNRVITVSNATFVVFEQVTYQETDETREPFFSRVLVTMYDPFSIEEDVRKAVEHMDQVDNSTEV